MQFTIFLYVNTSTVIRKKKYPNDNILATDSQFLRSPQMCGPLFICGNTGIPSSTS